jgi:hypothetical protein
LAQLADAHARARERETYPVEVLRHLADFALTSAPDLLGRVSARQSFEAPAQLVERAARVVREARVEGYDGGTERSVGDYGEGCTTQVRVDRDGQCAGDDHAERQPQHGDALFHYSRPFRSHEMTATGGNSA